LWHEGYDGKDIAEAFVLAAAKIVRKTQTIFLVFAHLSFNKKAKNENIINYRHNH
jgi:hypothetical protein